MNRAALMGSSCITRVMIEPPRDTRLIAGASNSVGEDELPPVPVRWGQSNARSDLALRESFMPAHWSGDVPDLGFSPWGEIEAYIREARARGERVARMLWTHRWPSQ